MFDEQPKGHREGPKIQVQHWKVQERGTQIGEGMQDLESSGKEKLKVNLAPQSPPHTVKSKCTALLNRKHGRFGMVRALASAHALCLTTYYHVPEYFG